MFEIANLNVTKLELGLLPLRTFINILLADDR